MGLFNKVLETQQKRPVALTPAEAFAAISLVATAIEGPIAEDDASTVINTLAKMQLFRNYSSDVVIRMFNKLRGLLRQYGAESLLVAAVEVLPYELHETAFTVTTDIISAGGSITTEESNFLNRLYSLLDINENLATQIIQVMLIKNRA